MMPQTNDEAVRYYTSAELQLREDVPGAFVWAVCLERTMLTYFEVQPHSRFERHQHESEQITLVLGGELFFETGGQVIAVKAGEVIALPSTVPHAVFTREHPVRRWMPGHQSERIIAAKSAPSSLWAIQCCTHASAWRHA